MVNKECRSWAGGGVLYWQYPYPERSSDAPFGDKQRVQDESARTRVDGWIDCRGRTCWLDGSSGARRWADALGRASSQVALPCCAGGPLRPSRRGEAARSFVRSVGGSVPPVMGFRKEDGWRRPSTHAPQSNRDDDSIDRSNRSRRKDSGRVACQLDDGDDANPSER
jgi:hypothetical protein